MILFYRNRSLWRAVFPENNGEKIMEKAGRSPLRFWGGCDILLMCYFRVFAGIDPYSPEQKEENAKHDVHRN